MADNKSGIVLCSLEISKADYSSFLLVPQVEPERFETFTKREGFCVLGSFIKFLLEIVYTTQCEEEGAAFS